ncbi:unnamed protein product [Ceratitis capitata]|uniref:(Mediterranean fruit fly) hypothetical protein n=1 Tax=Ceratitis capitata TaxID=7213 RepID=A0A811V1C6_CERCA|nr:unnamed protein product [Ceratitis capitata]
MDLSKKLSEQGWHLTDDGIKKITAAASNASGIDVNDVRKIIPIITDMDFREIAGGALPTKRDDNILVELFYSYKRQEIFQHLNQMKTQRLLRDSCN